MCSNIFPCVTLGVEEACRVWYAGCDTQACQLAYMVGHAIATSLCTRGRACVCGGSGRVYSCDRMVSLGAVSRGSSSAEILLVLSRQCSSRSFTIDSVNPQRLNRPRAPSSLSPDSGPSARSTNGRRTLANVPASPHSSGRIQSSAVSDASGAHPHPATCAGPNVVRWAWRVGAV